MSQQDSSVGSNKWILVPSDEIRQIQKRCPTYFTREEAEEELHRFVDSRIRILMCSDISPKIQEQVVNESYR